MQVAVKSPVSGVICPITDVPDDVFAQQMLGPGVAVLANTEDVINVLAPIDGLVQTVMPHAFVLTVDSTHSLLVHLGVDTFSADADVFCNLVEAGAKVTCGTPLIEWDTSASAAKGITPWVMLTVLGDPRVTLHDIVGRQHIVSVGDPLFTFYVPAED